eukprot:2915012-Prymnesium_polylepis.1
MGCGASSQVSPTHKTEGLPTRVAPDGDMSAAPSAPQPQAASQLQAANQKVAPKPDDPPALYSRRSPLRTSSVRMPISDEAEEEDYSLSDSAEAKRTSS